MVDQDWEQLKARVMDECRRKFIDAYLLDIRVEHGSTWLYFDNGFKIQAVTDHLGYAEWSVQVISGKEENGTTDTNGCA